MKYFSFWNRFLENPHFCIKFYHVISIILNIYYLLYENSEKGCFESNRSILNSYRSKATSKKSDPSSPKLCSPLNPRLKRKRIILHPLPGLGNNPTPNPKALKKCWRIWSEATPWWNTRGIPASRTAKWSTCQMITNIYVGSRGIKKTRKVSQLPPSSKSGRDAASPTTKKTGNTATCPRP